MIKRKKNKINYFKTTNILKNIRYLFKKDNNVYINNNYL